MSRIDIREDIFNLLHNQLSQVKSWTIDQMPAEFPAVLIYPPSDRRKIVYAHPNIYRKLYVLPIRIIMEGYSDRLKAIEVVDEIDESIEDIIKANPTYNNKYWLISYMESRIIFGEYDTDYWQQGLVILEVILNIYEEEV